MSQALHTEGYQILQNIHTMLKTIPQFMFRLQFAWNDCDEYTIHQQAFRLVYQQAFWLMFQQILLLVYDQQALWLVYQIRWCIHNSMHTQPITHYKFILCKPQIFPRFEYLVFNAVLYTYVSTILCWQIH